MCAAAGSEERLRRMLADESGCRVDLVLTRNRSSIVSIRFISEMHASVRIHAGFLHAPEEVRRSLARFLRTRKSSDWKVVAEYARGIDTSSERGAAAEAGYCGRGEVHDLVALAAEVNRKFFKGRVKYRIGWGRHSSSRGRGRGISIRYGSWDPRSAMIRIHPLLDDSRVPADFVRFIIYHEMLHAIVPSETNGERRNDHTAFFRRQERAFPDYDRMQRLAKELLTLLKG